MKNITLSDDEDLIARARAKARIQGKTLNAVFRKWLRGWLREWPSEWLDQFTANSGGTKDFGVLMKPLKYVEAGRRFSRDEMNA